MNTVSAIFLENLLDDGPMEELLVEFCSIDLEIYQVKNKIKFLSSLKRYKSSPEHKRGPFAYQIYEDHFQAGSPYEIAFSKSLLMNIESIRYHLEDYQETSSFYNFDSKLYYPQEQSVLMSLTRENVLERFLSSKKYRGIHYLIKTLILFLI
jgi:hypothetical protein